MGRLFWKLFLAFWLALIVAVALVGALVALHQQDARDEAVSLAGGPRTELALRSAAATLRHGGTEALRDWLLDDDNSRAASGVYAVGRNGDDLLGRPVSDEAIERAREHAHTTDPRARRSVRYDEASGLLLFVPSTEAPRRARRAASVPPLAIVSAGLLASLAFSALLAWYLTKPIHHLRSGFRSLAGGALDTRVAERMGRRNDELADLGRDFDRTAGQLQQLIDAQRRLLHDVSHELRSPLARLQAAIGIARQDPARRDAMLERIERETVRVDGLVGELLTLARLEAGSADAAIEQVDLADLVASIVDDAHFEARASGRELAYEEQLERRHVNGRAELLHRAFENVVRNALKFAPPGSRIDVRAQSSADGPFRLLVCDRGPGIADDERESIFEPFHRGRTGASERGTAAAPGPGTGASSSGTEAPVSGTGQPASGYGLGLAIARRAIELHGGRIAAAPREGGGLVVTIELPM